MRENVVRPPHAAFTAVATVMLTLLGLAPAQEGPFTSESLRGTYVAFLGNDVRPGEPSPNRASSVMLHYPGDGSYHGVWMFMNQPGEPDTEGNSTRILPIDPLDPSSHSHFTGTITMTPQGYFTFASPYGDFHGVPRRIETIEGVPTLVEYWLVYAQPDVDTGGLAISDHVRLVDADILPPAPEEPDGGEPQ